MYKEYPTEGGEMITDWLADLVNKSKPSEADAH